MKNKDFWKIPISFIIFLGIIAAVFALRTGFGPTVITAGVLVAPLDLSDIDSKPTKININTADVLLLTRLPGIGTKMAERIMEYRNIYGPFEKIEDIMKVSGIGEKRFKTISGYISVTDD